MNSWCGSMLPQVPLTSTSTKMTLEEYESAPPFILAEVDYRGNISGKSLAKMGTGTNLWVDPEINLIHRHNVLMWVDNTPK